MGRGFARVPIVAGFRCGRIAGILRPPRPMLSLRSVCVLLCGLVAPLAAQSSYTPGFELVAWSNSATIGSPVLDAMVHYPALTTGYAAPKLPRSGGWPTVVFLHGYDKIGLDYHDLGQAWASAGIVVVMLNTARTVPSLPEQSMPCNTTSRARLPSA